MAQAAVRVAVVDDDGGEWSFTRAVWAPTTKEDGTSGVFYSLVGHVRRGDARMHLRDEGNGAAFMG